MPGHEERAWKYGTTVYAALILIAIAIGTFIYTVILAQPEEIDDYVYDSSSGVPVVNPDDSMLPDHAPSVPPPTTPPPGN